MRYYFYYYIYFFFKGWGVEDKYMSGCQGLRDRENPAPSLSIFFSLKGVGWGGWVSEMYRILSGSGNSGNTGITGLTGYPVIFTGTGTRITGILSQNPGQFTSKPRFL